MKISIMTLGCKVNQSESASMEEAIREHGHEIVPMLRDNNNPGTNRDRPDVCIVNTCTVTAKSDYQSRQLIRRAVKSGARVIATGCYAQIQPDELSKIRGLDVILGNSEKGNMHEYLYKLFPKSSQPHGNPPISPSGSSLLGFNKGGHNGGLLKEGKGDFRTEIFVNSPETPMPLGSFASKMPALRRRVRAFLKIQDGCNFSCSYCTVPMARGKSRSLKPENVLKAVEKYSNEGYKEIVLTGIHTGSYGLDLQPGSSLSEIVKQITKSYPNIRFRLSSLEPQEVNNNFLSLITNGYLCRHLHIPLQSGSDTILKKMKRGYSTSFFKELIHSIALACPDISIGTDVIVGFPGERDEDFQDTVNLLKQLPISYIHVFPYSKRHNTEASMFPDQISIETKKKRVHILIGLSNEKKNHYITKQLGQRLDVIVENKSATRGYYRAISDNYIRPFVCAKNLISGQRLPVEASYFKDGELICTPV